MKILRYMLVFLPLAFAAEFLHWSPLLIFTFSCIALIPLAGLLGEATEELAIHTGPKVGGLLNATLGNAAELIITIVALSAGKVELVKASITGSILGNLLLILGLSLLLGGLKHGIQRFDRNLAGMNATMMILAVIGLIIPTMFELIREVQLGQVDVFNTTIQDPALNNLSLGVAGILMVLYVLSLIFMFRQPDKVAGSEGGHHAAESEGHGGHHAEGEHHTPKWNIPTASGVLAASTIGIVFLSEFLVGAVEPVVASLGVSELFLGIIIIPLVGNVAEHIVGVQVAYKNKMDLSLAISLGSSTQIALFVAPLLVFVSLLFGPEMTLFFSPLEVAGLALSVIIAAFIAVDGESNWLEGAQLLAVYLILALGFLFLTSGLDLGAIPH
ncbi:MAG TPA: calcium/proton exchanger [Roseiflexaceae bacterium]|nr:calcium/proton exchanger [Roseiflexaceae bacterium]